VIVGPGDGRALVALAERLRIADRVLLCGPRSDVRGALSAFDVFVHPAIAESFGMVIVEAMAMARPVLSTPVGIAPELIEPGETGLLCASPDPGALAEGLRGMIELRSRWSAMGAGARRRVAGLTASCTARRYQDLYARWIDRSSYDTLV